MSSPIEAYGKPPSKKERDRLVEEYLPLVHHVLGRLPLHLPPTLDKEDLFEIGVLGLINAASTFNAARGATFKTYAYLNVRGAILDELRKHDVVPRSRRDRLRQLGAVEARLEDALGRCPTPEEIAIEAGLSIEQVEEALVHAHGMAVLSLEEPTGSGDGDGPRRLIDSLSMPESPDPADAAAHNELKAQLATAIQELPERERHVIVLYYAEGLRLKEIGRILDVTESRVSQLHARALYRLNRALADKRTPA